MAFERRDFGAGNAIATTITAQLTAGATVSFAIAASTNWPDGTDGNFFVALDPTTDLTNPNSTFEVIKCSTRSGLTVNIASSGRAAMGTSDATHASGARAWVISTTLDLDEANYWVAELAGAIGAAGTIPVGDADNSLTGLAKGSNSTVLGVSSGGVLGYAQAATAQIADDAVTNDKLANITRGSVKVGGTANAPTDLDAKTSGRILVGDGTDVVSVAVSGDATLASSGALTVANGAITAAKVAADVATQAELDALPVRAPGTTFPASPAAGDLFYDTDDNLLYVHNGTDWVCITPKSAQVLTNESTSSTSYADLSTAGPAVTIQTGTKALVTISARIDNTGATSTSYASVAVSGATTLAAADNNAAQAKTGGDERANSRIFLLTGLTAGENVITMKYRTTGDEGVFGWRDLTVVGVP